MSPCRGLRGSVQREHGGRAIVVQPLDQHPEDLTGPHGHAVTIGGHTGEAIDEDTPRPDGPRLRQEQAVLLLHFLPEYPGTRRDDLHRAPVLEILQAPAEGRGVLDEPVRRHLEGDDHSRLVEFARASIDELDAQAGLAGPRPPRDQDHVALRDAAAQDRVEPRNTRLQECSPHARSLARVPRSAAQARIPLTQRSLGNARPLAVPPTKTGAQWPCQPGFSGNARSSQSNGRLGKRYRPNRAVAGTGLPGRSCLETVRGSSRYAVVQTQLDHVPMARGLRWARDRQIRLLPSVDRRA